MTDEPRTAEDLAELVQSLARQQYLAELAKRQLKIAEADLAATAEAKAVDDCKVSLRTATDTAKALEDLVRADALAIANRDATPKPAPGIEVVGKTTFEISDRAAATAWARTNMPLALVLDDGAFGKSVLALPAPEAQAVPGISLTVDKYGQVRISSKLQELYPTGA